MYFISINRLTWLFLAICIYCSCKFQQATCADNPDDPAGDWVRVMAEQPPDERFYQLYRSIFDPQSDEISPEVVTERLNEARVILLNVNCHIENRDHYSRQLQTFMSIPIDSGCSAMMLSQRIQLEQQNEQHPNLNPFMKFYNKKQFQFCTQKLDQDLLAHSWESEMLQNVRRVASNIRAVQRASNNANSLATDLTIRDISKSVISQVEFTLNRSMDKPANKSMEEQVIHVANSIVLVFFMECNTLNQLGESYYLYQLIMLYDKSLRSLFRRSVASLLDRVEVCRTIIFHCKYLYPLARFNLHQLTEQILDTQQPEIFMNPERMRDLLDISLHVGQAELILGIDNGELMIRFINYLAVSQLRVDKCKFDYLDKLSDLIEANQLYPNLHHYLKQFASSQVIVCIRPLEFTIFVLTNPLVTADMDSKLLRDVKDLFANVGSELYGDVKLYEEIPDGLASIVLERYTKEHNIGNHRASQSDEAIEFRSLLQKLDRTCNDFVRSLELQAKLFTKLLKLDFNGGIRRYGTVRNEISKYNMCMAILRLPQE